MQRMSPARTPTLPGDSARARTVARLIGWIAASGMLVGAGIGLIRGLNLGPDYLTVSVLKGTVLGVTLAVTLGGLELIALHGMWRRLALGRAILVRTALYTPVALGIFLLVSAAFSPWIAWSLQREMILP